MYDSENFLECSVCSRLVLFLAYIFWGREFAQTFATSIINTALLSHQWSKACSQSTMPGDRNSTHCMTEAAHSKHKQHTMTEAAHSTHCVLWFVFTFAWSSCRLLL